MGCGTIIIKNQSQEDYNLFDFGISQTNGSVPFVWGGQILNLENGFFGKYFEGLTKGTYRWFVRYKQTQQIVASGYSEVVCESEPNIEKASYTKQVNGVLFLEIFKNEHKLNKVHGIACYDQQGEFIFATPNIRQDTQAITISFLSSFHGRVEIF